MALLFMDSFDHYATADILEKWPGATVGTGTIGAFGRNSTNGFRISIANFVTSFLGNAFSSNNTVILGIAIKFSANQSVSDVPFLQILDGTTTQFRISLGNGGVLIVRNGNDGTTYGTTPAIFTPGVFTYLEMKAVIHSSTGSIEIKKNGTSVLNLTGLFTNWSGNGVWNGIKIGSIASANATTATCDFDDFYVLDGIGSPNAYLGDVRVDARRSTGAGTTTGWTPSTGANWQNVDDAAPNDDTDYNSTTTLNAIDTFIVEDAPVVGATLYGIQHNLSMKKMDAGSVSVAPVIRHSGTNNAGSNINPSTAYAFATQITTEIAPGVAITESNFNAAEFGYKKTV